MRGVKNVVKQDNMITKISKYIDVREGFENAYISERFKKYLTNCKSTWSLIFGMRHAKHIKKHKEKLFNFEEDEE